MPLLASPCLPLPHLALTTTLSLPGHLPAPDAGSWVGKELRQAEQELLELLSSQLGQEKAESLQLCQVAPFSPQQRQQWRQALARLAGSKKKRPGRGGGGPKSTSTEWSGSSSSSKPHMGSWLSDPANFTRLQSICAGC